MNLIFHSTLLLSTILLLGTFTVLPEVFSLETTPPFGNIVYENGSPFPSDGLYIDMAITANDFELEDDSELTDVHFILQDDTGNGLNVPIQYEIREHNVDRPSNVVVPFGSGTAINVHTEQIEPCTTPFTCERLLVWFDFEQPIPLDGGVTYWLILHAGENINDNTQRFFFWEQSDVNLGFETVSFFIDEPDELIFIFDSWFQLTSKQPPPFGDFKCWGNSVTSNPPSTIQLEITDQFNQGGPPIVNNLWVPNDYCTAAEKNGQDSPFSPDLNQHYQVWFYPPSLEGPGTGITVNLEIPQFDDLNDIVIGNLDSIFVPATKDTGSGPQDSFDDQRHWNCYDLEFSNPPLPAPTNNLVTLFTQHFEQDAEVFEPFLLCAPMVKFDGNNFFPADQSLIEDHMVCYDLGNVSIEETFENLPNTLIDQLASNIFDGNDDVQVLCVPALKSLPAELPADHYLGYKVKETKHTDKFEKMTVTLSDQFEDNVLYKVEKPDRLYNPVDKEGEGISDDITHYVGYKIKIPKGDPKFEKVTNVLVENQFGQIIVDVKKPKLLLVPSLKDHDQVPVITDSFTINHFKCYDVKETKDTPKFEKRIVSLYDPNFEMTQDFEVKKPKMLCNPVEKQVVNADGTVETTPIQNPENHLMCYDLKKMKDTPKFEKRNVFTNNQFGPEDLEVKKQKQLCVPSIKTLP